jgi:nicotinamide phosphoribosyltransferase
MKINSLLVSDAYKQSHRIQYPEGTTLVYSNWTPRSDRHANTDSGVVVFGIQSFLNKLTNDFDDNFFNLGRKRVVEEFRQGYLSYFGENPDVTHVTDLYDLGYLPIKVKALKEGTICPIGVPMLTIVNTKPEFYWIVNFLETIMSTELWLPMTSATIAREYRTILDGWGDLTCDNNDHVQFQGHDFSMRGMSGLEAAMASGAGHLLSFVGSDTIPAMYYLKEHYVADIRGSLVACSIPATEHSVMSMGTKGDELGTFRRLITDTYPNGLISIVSDTWDLWKVLTDYVPALRDEILARDGKVVIRPDSGDPVDIICGTGNVGPLVSDAYKQSRRIQYPEGTTSVLADNIPKIKGVIELLWDTFGGTINSKGYKVLDSHIGAIYGDSITIQRANEICSRLAAKGFASSNIVFGIGSFTYQFNTRDTYGFAMKATYGEVNHVGREIFKDPVTDDGGKKSLKGLIRVIQSPTGEIHAQDQVTPEEERTGLLKTVYKNGLFVEVYTLDEIKSNLNKQ